MKKVAVVGAGYGGLRAIEHLSKNKNYSLILFDENPYHYLQTEAYGYIAGRFDMRDVALDLKSWCYGFENHVEFVQQKVLAIDSGKNSIKTDSSEYEFDYLIIATGARTNFFKQITGLKEYAHGVKKLFRSHRFRTAFENLLYEKLIEHKNDGDVINLAIGGAGLSGVEIAAEMADVIQRHTKCIGECAKEIEICLIDASDTILPGMSPYIIKNTQQRLKNLGIKVLTSSFIHKVEEDAIHFQDGTTLPYTFMIFTGGIIANTVPLDLEFQTNRIGQYICNENLQITENIFAIGDCCELKDKKGNLLPPTAQTAERSAEYVAKTITQLESSQKISKFNGKVDGVFVALGGYYAVGELFGVIKVKGELAYLLKKLITKVYYVGLKLRLNTGFMKRTTKAQDRALF